MRAVQCFGMPWSNFSYVLLRGSDRDEKCCTFIIIYAEPALNKLFLAHAKKVAQVAEETLSQLLPQDNTVPDNTGDYVVIQKWIS